MPPELSVVVPSRDGDARLAVHLPRLADAAAALGVAWEGVVVDDASAAGPPGADTLPAGFALLPLAGHEGAAGARNAGARRSRGVWLLFVDDDVELDAAALRALWAARREDACVVPEVRTADGGLQNALVRTQKLLEPRWVHEPEPVAEVDYPLGACLLVPRALFERAGGFDRRFRPNYFEDTAFGEALRRTGARTLMVAGAVARHFEPAAAERSRRQKAAISANRWRYVFHYTRGGRRAGAIALAPLRVARESVATRSLLPLAGLARALASELPLRRPAAR
ncbi:MAG TPA: glycosyltransferase [Gaiellaceae bacterium]|nr:glycosyltransferase [Gaiellaceae bacterium]